MDGVIVSLAVLLLSVMAILLGSSAQHQSFIPEKRPGLIHPSSSIEQYSDNGRSMKSWPPNPLTYQMTDRKSRKSKGKGPKRLAKLTAKMKKWLKKRDKKLEEEIFDFDNILIAMENPTPVYDQEFSANGSIPNDRCDSNSVKFDSDGQCYPLMGREPCSDPRQWVTVDPETFKVNYTQIKISYVIPVKSRYKQCRLSFDNIRDGALRVFAEETESLSFARDFVTTFTINPSVQEDEDFTIRLTEILCAVVPSERIHTRTLGTIAFHFSRKVFFKQ